MAPETLPTWAAPELPTKVGDAGERQTVRAFSPQKMLTGGQVTISLAVMALSFVAFINVFNIFDLVTFFAIVYLLLLSALLIAAATFRFSPMLVPRPTWTTRPLHAAKKCGVSWHGSPSLTIVSVRHG